MQITRIKTIKKLGLQKSLDFEIDSPQHNFVADGVVVSNSHSTSYGYISIITAYLKFSYTKEFFLCLLRMAKHESKLQELVGQISKEMPHFGLKLLPPDIFKSKEDFSIEQDGIRFGLSSIKGISEKTIEKVVSFAKSLGENKYSVFIAAKEAKMSIGVLSALIHVGALGDKQRCRKVLEAQAWNVLTDREKRNFTDLGEKHDYDILSSIKKSVDEKILADDGKPIMSDKRFETFKAKYSKYKAIYEKNSAHESFANWFFEDKLLGYSPSQSLKNCCKNPQDYTSLGEMRNLPDDADVKVIAKVKEAFWKKSKAGSNYMRIEISDDAGEGSAMLFEKGNKNFATFKETTGKKIKEDSLIQITGRKKNDAIFAREIMLIDDKIYLKYSDLEKDSKEV